MGGKKLEAFLSLQFGDLHNSDKTLKLIRNPTDSSIVAFSPNFYSKVYWGRKFLKTSDQSLAVLSPFIPANPYLAPYPPYPPVVPVTNASGQLVYVPIHLPMAMNTMMNVMEPTVNGHPPPVNVYPYSPYGVSPPVMINGMVPNTMTIVPVSQNVTPFGPDVPNGFPPVPADQQFVQPECNGAPSPLDENEKTACLPTLAPEHSEIDSNADSTHDLNLPPLTVVDKSLEASEVNVQINIDLPQHNDCNDSQQKLVENEKIFSNDNAAETECSSVSPEKPMQANSNSMQPDQTKKPALWSSFFSSSSGKVISFEQTPSHGNKFPATTDLSLEDKVAHDQFTYFIHEKIVKLSSRSLPKVLHLNPRGMNNFGNRCYIHSALQVLVNLPQFYHLMSFLPERQHRDVEMSTTPTLDALKELISQFKVYKFDRNPNKFSRSRVSPEFTIDEPFTVQGLVKNLTSHKMFAQGQQEDVEEFLFFLLDSLHEELASINAVYGKSSKTSNDQHEKGSMAEMNGTERPSEDEDSGGWVSMGPKRRERVHREVASSQSPITDIFGGLTVNEIRKKSEKSSCTTQRFFTLRLDIEAEKVKTITDALNNTFASEVIQQSDRSEITQISYLQKLPETLILQFKLFVYNSEKSTVEKVTKFVAFEETLEIPPGCFGGSRNYQGRRFKLFAVVYHHGADANKGHYSAAIFHTGQKIWFCFDDARVSRVELKNVLNCNINDKVPYLVIYRKID